VTKVLEPNFFFNEIAQMVDNWWETLTPEEREKHDRERRIEEKWELLKREIEKWLDETHPIRDDAEHYVLSEILALMDKLERGEPIE
jgi:molecular chaperone GrpE (heat shock protein)